MRPTLAELHKENMPKLARDFPSIVAMAHHFTKCSDMDRALGYSGAVAHWMSLRNAPSNGSERAASLWLQANRKDAAQRIEAPGHEPIASLPAEMAATLMAIVPRERTEKVMRVLTMLGVECIEV